MKTGNFEKKLQHQPLRAMPATWRGEILAKARGQMRPARREESIALWRLFFARCSVAWGALAMLWAVLIVANFILAAPNGRTSVRPVLALRAEPLAVWNLQRAESSLLNDQPMDASGQPFRDPPRPRSDGPRHEGYGGFPANLEMKLPA